MRWARGRRVCAQPKFARLTPRDAVVAVSSGGGGGGTDDNGNAQAAHYGDWRGSRRGGGPKGSSLIREQQLASNAFSVPSVAAPPCAECLRQTGVRVCVCVVCAVCVCGCVHDYTCALAHVTSAGGARACVFHTGNGAVTVREC